jgi:protein KRI1
MCTIFQSKPVTLRQAALESALNPESRSPSPEPLPHVEEQRTLRNETIAAFHHAVDDQDNDGGLFVPREKTKDEQEREEEGYKAFLEREVGGDLQALVTVDAHDEIVENLTDHEAEDAKKNRRNTKAKVAKKKDESHRNSKQESDQEFLIKYIHRPSLSFAYANSILHSYIMNRGWIDRSEHHIPTYREVISSKSKGKGKAKQEPSTTDSESGQVDDSDRSPPTADPEIDDDDFEEIVNRFESSYNFRFEEP